MEDRITPEKFVLLAIEALRKPPYKGIHSVYSGFNQAFREYFPGLDPVQITSQMAEEGKIVVRPVKGGVMLYLPEDAPQVLKTKEVIKKILERKAHWDAKGKQDN